MVEARRSLNRRTLTEDRIRNAAAEQFSQRGFAATSLQDIADALGTGRTALYHYVNSKDELFLSLLEDFARTARKALSERLIDVDTSPIDALHAAVVALVNLAASHPALVRLLDTTGRDLPPDGAASLKRHNRRFFRDLTALVQRGIDVGSFRPVDAGVTAHAIAGITRSLAWWYDPSGPTPLPVLADEIAVGVVRGLLADDTPWSPTEVRAALTRMQHDLDRVRKHLDGS